MWSDATRPEVSTCAAAWPLVDRRATLVIYARLGHRMLHPAVRMPFKLREWPSRQHWGAMIPGPVLTAVRALHALRAEHLIGRRFPGPATERSGGGRWRGTAIQRAFAQ